MIDWAQIRLCMCTEQLRLLMPIGRGAVDSMHAPDPAVNASVTRRFAHMEGSLTVSLTRLTTVSFFK